MFFLSSHFFDCSDYYTLFAANLSNWMGIVLIIEVCDYVISLYSFYQLLIVVIDKNRFVTNLFPNLFPN